MSNAVLPGHMACPDCDGTGSVNDGRRIPESFFQPAEYDFHPCDRCVGEFRLSRGVTVHLGGEVLDPEFEYDEATVAIVLSALSFARRPAAKSLGRASASPSSVAA